MERRRERGPNSIIQDTKGTGEIGQGRLDRSETRGNSKKLKKSTCRRDVKKYSFPHK